MKIPLRKAAVFFVLAALSVFGKAEAYQALGTKWNITPVTFFTKWDNGGQFDQAFAAAGNQWGGHSNFNFNADTTRYVDPCASRSAPDYKNSYGFSSNNCGAGWGNSTLAITASWFQGTELVDSDVVFNANFTWSVHSNEKINPVDFRRVAVHELGHALGLGHESVNPAIMHPSYSFTTLSPQQDDIAGLLNIYGQNVGFSQTFNDVPPWHPFFGSIETLVSAGITGGCSQQPPLYCPDQNVRRDQMAVFIGRAMNAVALSPTGQVFADVPKSHWAAAAIEQFVADGITSGCTSSPAKYCPDALVTRAQMAVFLLKAKYGPGFSPKSATGKKFNDVAANSFAADWIEELVAQGITGGCSATQYCPDAPVNRAQMAAFMVRTFAL